MQKQLHTVRYGLGADNDYRAEDLSYPDGFPSFTMVHGEVRVPVKLTVMGEHNVMNALAALAVADAYGVPLADAAESCLNLAGSRTVSRFIIKMVIRSWTIPTMQARIR